MKLFHKIVLILLCLSLFCGCAAKPEDHQSQDDASSTDTANITQQTPAENPESSENTELCGIIYGLDETGKPVEFEKIQKGQQPSYMAEVIINDAIKLLVEEKGNSQVIAEKMIYASGYRIISTVDPSVQQAIDSVYKNHDAFKTSPENSQAQSAIVVMDPQTGYVKGLSGGIGERDVPNTVNRAVDTYRQPGSCLTPLSVYAPAIEAGLIDPNSLYEDKPVTYGGWTPKNSYSGYKGQMTVQKAMDLSVNTVPLQILEELGKEESYRALQNDFCISGLSESDKAMVALGLGGMTQGVTVMDMTAAYAPFANNGIYTKPITVLEIQDNTGKTVVKTSPETHYAMSKKTAEKMHQMLLSAVNNPGATGVNAKRSDVKVGGKTGSTDGNKDRWFVGYTPNYVAAVWYGFDTPKNVSSNYNPALLAWDAVMDEIMADASQKEYVTKTPSTIPTSNFSVQICSITGLDAAQHCIDQGSVISQTFTERTPQETCTEQAHGITQSDSAPTLEEE